MNSELEEVCIYVSKNCKLQQMCVFLNIYEYHLHIALTTVLKYLWDVKTCFGNNLIVFCNKRYVLVLT